MNNTPDADTLLWRARMAAYMAEYNKTNPTPPANEPAPGKRVRVRRAPKSAVSEPNTDQVRAKAIYEKHHVLRDILMMGDEEYECAYLFEDNSNPDMPRTWAVERFSPILRDY